MSGATTPETGTLITALATVLEQAGLSSCAGAILLIAPESVGRLFACATGPPHLIVAMLVGALTQYGIKVEWPAGRTQ